jgi:hypothetical protein
MTRALPLVILLAGCAGAQVPIDLSKMSADQIKAAAADRSAVGSCSQVVGPWGTGRIVYVQLDRGTAPNAEVTINAECTVTIKSQGKQ